MKEIGSDVQPLIVAQSLSLHLPLPTAPLPATISPENTGLGPINLVLPDNQLVALLGGAGAGKSLLFRVLTGEIPADFGHLRLLDSQVTFPTQSQADFQPLARPDQLVYLPAETPRPQKETLTKLMDSSFPVTAHPPLKQWRDQIVKQLGIAAWLDFPLARLSAGQWQICRWALALLMKPRIILADHPTCFLPKTQSIALIDFLKNYIARTHALIVCATNDPNLAQRADRLLFMVAGQIADSAPETAPPTRHLIALPDEETPENKDDETDLTGIFAPSTPICIDQPTATAIPAIVDQANWEDSWPALAAALLPGTGRQKGQINPDALGNLGILGPGASVVPEHLQTPQGAREYLRSHHGPNLQAIPDHLDQQHSLSTPDQSSVSSMANSRETPTAHSSVTGQNNQPIVKSAPIEPGKETIFGVEAQKIRKYPPRRNRLQR